MFQLCHNCDQSSQKRKPSLNSSKHPHPRWTQPPRPRWPGYSLSPQNLCIAPSSSVSLLALLWSADGYLLPLCRLALSYSVDPPRPRWPGSSRSRQASSASTCSGSRPRGISRGERERCKQGPARPGTHRTAPARHHIREELHLSSRRAKMRKRLGFFERRERE